MATSGTYYLNGPTLSSSTAVFTDIALSICAPDGFYSDGSIVREQVGCSLLPAVICPSCATPCNTNISGSGGQGIYYVDSDTGTSTGAIIIRFQPFGVPDGILAQLGPNTYNGMSSQNYGWLQGTPGLPTYVGETASDCGILAGSPYTGVSEFEYQGTGFVNLGTTTTVNVVSGQLQFTANPPGICTMVIPKSSNAYTVLSSQVIGLCPGTGFGIEIECPEELPTWFGSLLAATGSDACLLSNNTTYYYVHVNGSGGVLALYDMVFADPNGEFPLSAGYYNTGSMSTAYDYVHVDANGVVIGFGICEEATNYIIQKCYTNEQEVVAVTGTISPGLNVLVTEHPGCIWEVISTTTNPPTVTFFNVTTETCLFQCSTWDVTNTTGSPLEFSYEDCDGNSITFELPGGQTAPVCARSIDVIPPGLDIVQVDCLCDSPPVSFWEIRGCCNGDTLIALAGVAVDVGHLVKVTDTNYADCWFEVLAVSLGTPTTVIYESNLGEFGCSEVCCKYQVCNPDTITLEIAYIGCDGLPNVIELPPATCTMVCARSNSFGPSGLVVTFESCTC